MKKIIKEISKKVIGNERPSLLLLVSLFANGHILIEDVPGVGKTLLATSISKICNIDFARVQCTSDLLPGDILGFNMFDINTGEANYVKGPVMTNLLLVDEINRATPKTQSALLEVMEEHNISLDGKTFKVPEPFMVIATQNPIENSGTFPLPEAQLDRFTMKISLGYPNFQDEIKMLELYKNPELSPSLDSIISRNSILSVQEQIKTVTVDKTVIEYITNMVVKTRSHPDVALGCSPRSSLALMRCAQSLAFISGRDYVVPDDVKFLSTHVLAHRLILKSNLSGISLTNKTQEIINEIAKEIKVWV